MTRVPSSPAQPPPGAAAPVPGESPAPAGPAPAGATSAGATSAGATSAGRTPGDARGAAGPTPIAVARPRRATSGWRSRLATLGQRTPALVLVASLLLTVLATALAARIGRAHVAAEFATASQAAADRIRARVDAYGTLLDGAAALFAAHAARGQGVPTADEFRAYVARLELERRFPGVRGVGYSAVVWRAAGGRPFDPGTSLAPFRATGSEVARLWAGPAAAAPGGPARDEVHAIVYLEPRDAPNRAALGYDMHAEPVRRAAMDRARDGGAPAASGRVTLVQEIVPKARQAGFVMYVPVYAGGAVPPTVEARRRALAGFVYAPFRAGDLVQGVFAGERPLGVAFRVFDGPDTLRARLLADSRALGLTRDGTARPATRLVPLEVAGHRWTLAFAALDTPRLLGGLTGGDTAAFAVGVLGTLVSLTLALLTAAEVRARERVEASDALRGRFFAAMSHELRTPVNAVLGYNDLLLAGVYGELAGAQREGIQRSQRAARHLLELVNDVLDLSKLEAGKVEVSPEPVTLDAFLDDLRVTIGPLAAERGCALTLDARACAVTLHTDPRRLRQILLNLLSNATKFGAGRPVHVWCERRADAAPALGGRPAAGRAGAFVAVHVRDEGPGIAPEDQGRVFEEFVQLPGAAPGGTGLGLPISRRLAALLGGALTVHSAPGSGSTFTVFLPLGAPVAPDTGARPGRDRSG